MSVLADRHAGHLGVVVTVAERLREDELISDRHGSDQRIATRVELVDEPTDGSAGTAEVYTASSTAFGGPARRY